MKYLANCFLLILPILVWNVVYIDTLPPIYGPEIFWKNIPGWISTGENFLRIPVFMLPLLLKLSLKDMIQKLGILIYLIGSGLYYIAWIAQMYLSESWWSQSYVGFLAPAITPMIIFWGISLIGQKSFIKNKPISSIYLVLALLFTVFHVTHAHIVYARL